MSLVTDDITTLRTELENELSSMSPKDKMTLINDKRVNSYFLFLLEYTQEEVSQETMLTIKQAIIGLNLNVMNWK
ncbi:hypothetical protein ABC382_00040 [Lysinibacillus sp. 1P01SD]|uniref:hypothetical protein n=1 Tax=Lysinibacillus sp. 1P01SD TaxID=3132285 RepID=UPI0039A32DD4